MSKPETRSQPRSETRAEARSEARSDASAPRWRVRDALDEDADALRDMMRALQAYELRFEPNRAPPDAMAGPHMDALARWAADSDGAVLVAESGSGAAPVGFLVFAVVEEFGCFVARENQRYGVISDLFVQDAFRGAGVARALVDAARDRLVDLGVRRLEVTALWGNHGARAVYEALGLAPSHVAYAEKLPRR